MKNSTSNVAVAAHPGNSKTTKVTVDKRNLKFPQLSYNDFVTLLMYCNLVGKRLIYSRENHKAIIVTHELDKKNIAFVQKVNDKLVLYYKNNTTSWLPDTEVVERKAMEDLMYKKFNSIKLINGKPVNQLMVVMDTIFNQAKEAISL